MTDPLADERAWYGVDGHFDREGYESYVAGSGVTEPPNTRHGGGHVSPPIEAGLVRLPVMTPEQWAAMWREAQ